MDIEIILEPDIPRQLAEITVAHSISSTDAKSLILFLQNFIDVNAEN